MTERDPRERAAEVIGALADRLPRLAARLRELDPSLEAIVAEAERGAERVRAVARMLAARPAEEAPRPVSLAEVVADAVRRAGPEVRAKASLVEDYRDAPEVVAAPGALVEALVQLLVNAAQALPPGRAENRVAVRVLTGEGGAATVEIADNGPGVPPELRGRIFEPLYSTKGGQGAGLGLAVCRATVEGLGGSVTVDETPGGGATFRVRLPGREGP